MKDYGQELEETLDSTAKEPVWEFLTARNFYILLIIAQAFLLINGEYLYSIDKWAASIYIFVPMTMYIAMTQWGNIKIDLNNLVYKKDPLTKALPKAWKVKGSSLAIQMIYYFIGFIFLWTALIILSYKGLWTPAGQVDVLGAREKIVFTLVFVAPSETIIFHILLPKWAEQTFKMYKYRAQITYILSQASFSIFHTAAYGGEATAFGAAFVLGICLLYAARNFSPAVTMGLHSAYNLAVFGIGTAVILGA